MNLIISNFARFNSGEYPQYRYLTFAKNDKLINAEFKLRMIPFLAQYMTAENIDIMFKLMIEDSWTQDECRVAFKETIKNYNYANSHKGMTPGQFMSYRNSNKIKLLNYQQLLREINENGYSFDDFIAVENDNIDNSGKPVFIFRAVWEKYKDGFKLYVAPEPCRSSTQIDFEYNLKKLAEIKKMREYEK